MKKIGEESGFSIIELMVAMAVMLIIMVPIFTLSRDALRTSATAFELADAQQNMRTAQEYINRDLIVAGDGLRSVGNIMLPVAFVQKYLVRAPQTGGSSLAALSIITPDDDGSSTSTPPGVLPGTDRITILSIDPSFTPISLPSGAIVPAGANVSVTTADVSRFQVGEIYFITSQYGATFGAITNISSPSSQPNLIFSNSDPYQLNDPGNNGAIAQVAYGPSGPGKGNKSVPATLMRVRIINYFVNDKGQLIRRVFGVPRPVATDSGFGYADSVIAENVTNLQFRYQLNKTDNSGNLLPPSSQVAVSDQPSIRQIEVTVRTRTQRAVQVNNGMRPELSATTWTSVRNMQFRQALQP
ncbi:PilW family protein [Pyrinomonas methylaliphatogenes]|uniref:Prepilin-type N-terminal cleavage/methylation domain-containing protein n=1 Tax=Pyrinomonas methylaliphatogenes TaxID=454194 RepID=A0A0B6WY71_9BACT|nr:prepilin-type N-terminal cleavage/methylation domain-containing protein [Pyrinomonas methylaliphatogenes]CDM66213.1 prepilin-type N-terminal cleavage/methylation domain-containing protein [Pyrinomonas methylaliphatogenes]